MSNFSGFIKKHFVLSEADPLQMADQPTVRPASVSAHAASSSEIPDKKIAEKMADFKTCLDTLLSTTSREKFSRAFETARDDLLFVIPYERDFSFTCPLPSELLKTLLDREHKLTSAFQKRAAARYHYDSMDGHTFEQFCAKILTKNGFSDVTVTKGSGDQGIDILASKDFVRYGIQCKCYHSNIGNKAIQEAFTGANFYHCHLAVVLTNRDFTSAARELAEKSGVILWNREYLDFLIRMSC